jgi:hypothetical protein
MPSSFIAPSGTGEKSPGTAAVFSFEELDISADGPLCVVRCPRGDGQLPAWAGASAGPEGHAACPPCEGAR